MLLRDAMQQIVPYIESIRLVDQLAANAANAERERIGRDLHDSVVQSYIGLELGLRGIQNKLQRDIGPVSEIDRLIDLARAGAVSVRDVVSGLKEGNRSRGPLAESLARYIETFQQVTGIGVRLTVEPDLKLSERVAGEVFHICIEGLSNIRRHTTATQAALGILSAKGDVVVRIEDVGADRTPPDFTPKSIDARVASLGGRVTVSRGSPGGSIITAEIPL
ncbi:MAG TPA: histidine kinase, partial [Vicinamibacterales bacterium]|nr:histidine kinase [Vicinamibacterales bacterium]